MARSFTSIAAFVAFMEGVARTAHQAERQATDASVKVVLAKAKTLPGVYQAGWKQLAAATRADRVRKGFSPNDPLLRTGQLRDSYKGHVIDPRHGEVGSNDKRAEWFERGTSKMPPRPVLLTAAKMEEQHVHEIVGRRIYRHLCGNTSEG